MNKHANSASLIRVTSMTLAAFCVFWLTRSLYHELPAMRRYLRLSRM